MISEENYTLTYDELKRVTSVKIGNKTLAAYTYQNNGTKQIGSTTYTVTSAQVTTMTSGGITYSYTYDNVGNISSIKENEIEKVAYVYDNNNMLSREDNGYSGKTTVYWYDVRGNIQSVKEYAYTKALDLSNSEYNETIYGYSEDWQDQATAIGADTLTYDNLGNPTLIYNEFRNLSFNWDGRSLVGMNSSNRSGRAWYNGAAFEYNANGIRISKTYNGVRTEYSLSGDSVLRQTDGTYTIWFIYAGDNLVGLMYNDTSYYFRKNLQGDIVSILDASGNTVVSYVYDSWGKVLSVYGSEADGIGYLNPIRYRGYYYDIETGLYYLNSRYYIPEYRRFLNADGLTNSDGSYYAYCNNNPVMLTDSTGYSPDFKWYHWLAIGVGAALVIGAITVLTGGVGTSTLLGAIALGASKGALIGAGIGMVLGAGIGYSVGGLDGMFKGMALGFGGGALIGAVIGGFVGANGWFNAKALQFTNLGSKEVVLGRSPQYVQVAKSRGATFFNTTEDVWSATKAMRGVGNKGMWRINKAFLNQQIKAGANFVLSNPSSGFYYAKEIAYLAAKSIPYTFL